MSNSELKETGQSGVSILMAVAVFQRLFTFFLNALLLRFISADIVGFAQNDMELMLSTILFLSRESCRLVVMRAEPSFLISGQAATRSRYINTAWLPVPIGFILTAIAVLLFSPHANVGGEERGSFSVFILAAAIEVISEPFYIICNCSLMYNVRASAEVAGVTSRCIVTFVLAAFFGYTWMAFALGQLTFAFIQLAVYAYNVLNTLRQHSLPISTIAPKFGIGLFQDKDGSLLGGFFLQSIVKHLLTEGDRLLLTALASRQQRGVYAVTVNYGSLPARFFFQPLEEALRNTISKVASAKSLSAKEQRAAAFAFASATGQLVLFVGSVFALFGGNFAGLGALLGFGKTWRDADLGSVLSLYCVYVFFLACNGASEAAATAVADSSRVKWSTVHLALSFAAYASLAYALLPSLGVKGIIIANMLNMTLRTMSSLSYLHSWMVSAGLLINWRKVLPSTQTCAAIAASFLLFSCTNGQFASLYEGRRHIAAGVISCTLVATAALTHDFASLKAAWKIARGGRATKGD